MSGNFVLQFFSCRQFKEQQRLARTDGGGAGGGAGYPAKLSDPGRHALSSSSLGPARTTAKLSLDSAAASSRSASDIKSVQKEAVMSYIDRVGSAGSLTGTGRAGAPPDSAPPPPPATAAATRPTAASSIPSRVSMAGGRGRAGPPPPQQTFQGAPSTNFTQRREADRVAAQDSHIQHLRQQIESRLKVGLSNMVGCSNFQGCAREQRKLRACSRSLEICF